MTAANFIKTWFSYIDGKNQEGLKEMMDEQHQFVNPMMPVPATREQHLGMIDMMTSAFEGQHLVDIIVSEGGWISVRGRWNGTHTGEFNGVPATGRPVTFSWMDMMHLVNGKIVEEYFEMNPMAIMQQIETHNIN